MITREEILEKVNSYIEDAILAYPEENPLNVEVELCDTAICVDLKDGYYVQKVKIVHGECKHRSPLLEKYIAEHVPDYEDLWIEALEEIERQNERNEAYEEQLLRMSY